MASTSSAGSDRPADLSTYDGLKAHMAGMRVKNLAIFSFNNTIVNCHTDIAAMNIIDVHKFPSDLQDSFESDNWINCMQTVFEILHQNNIKKKEFIEFVKKMKEVPQMRSLIVKLHDALNFDIVIISDANTFFIKLWLQINGLASRVYKVFSNHAEFDEAGMLKLDIQHPQEKCPLSSSNLCKGKIYDQLLYSSWEKKIVYDRIFYIGQSKNDLCPVLRLGHNGIACCKMGSQLSKLVGKVQSRELSDGTKPYVLSADVCVWNNGEDVLRFFLCQ